MRAKRTPHQSVRSVGRLGVVLVALAALLPYVPALGCGFVLDDVAIVRDNPLIRDLRDIPSLLTRNYWAPFDELNLYRPLTIASYALNRAITGPEPWGFHAVNILLHAIASVLLLQIARRLEVGAAGGLVAGLTFAVLPIHTEAVVGIVGRAELLATIGALGALLLHIRGRNGGTTWSYYGAAAGLLFALAAKEVAAGVLLTFVLYDLTSWRAARRPTLAPYLPYAMAATTYAAARVAVLGVERIAQPPMLSLLDNPLVHAAWPDRLLSAAHLLTRYLSQALWPAKLSADYSYAQIETTRSLADPSVLAGVAVALLVCVGIGLACRRGDSALSVSLGLFIGTYFIVSNSVVLIGTIMAERLFYLPSAGLTLGFGVAASRLFSRCSSRARPLWAVVVALTLCASVRTWARCGDWKDERTLLAATVRTSPRSVRARVFYAEALVSEAPEDNREAARSELQRALEIDPELAWTWMAWSRFHGREHMAEAKSAAIKAIALEPGLAEAHYALGAIEVHTGQFEEGVLSFERALAHRPYYPIAKLALAEAHLGAGRHDRARPLLEELLESRPDLPFVHINRARLAEADGERDLARAAYLRARQLDDDLPTASLSLARMAETERDLEAALRHYRHAQSVSKPPMDAFLRAASILLEADRLDEAAEVFEAAAGARLRDARLENGAATVALRRGRRSEAIAGFRQALRIDPSNAYARHQLARLVDGS